MLRQSSIDYVVSLLKQLRRDDPQYLDQCQQEFKELFGEFASPAYKWNDESWSFWLHKCGTWRIKHRLAIGLSNKRKRR
jgi:hypothetical protein